MIFDFTDFEARVAEINRLNRELHAASAVRLKTQKDSDIRRWEEAAEKWKEYSGACRYPGTKFYLFESDSFLNDLRSGAPETVDCAIRYLEFDPYYYRSGYIKAKLLTQLKHLALSEAHKRRLRHIILNAVASPLPKAEFNAYLRLIPKIRNAEWDAALTALAIPETPWNRSRKLAALEKCFTG